VRWAGICDFRCPIVTSRNFSPNAAFADHTTIWRWVQCYAPELNRRCRRELKPTNGSWRVDETYVRVKGKWTYLYRAVDSAGATIDFLWTARRDAAAAKRFFLKALRAPSHPRPRVINVGGNPNFPKSWRN
jgi:transposase, IS6 family